MGVDGHKNRHRFQFTLRSFIATLVIALLGVSHWNTSRELASTRMALGKLERSLGQLEVADPTKMYARELLTYQRDRWVWRVHVPLDFAVDLQLRLRSPDPAIGQPPETVISFEKSPQSFGRLLTPGEWIVRFELAQGLDEKGAECWKTLLLAERLDGPTVHVLTQLPQNYSSWLASYAENNPVSTARSEAFDPRTPAMLLNLSSPPDETNESNLEDLERQLSIMLVPKQKRPRHVN